MDALWAMGGWLILKSNNRLLFLFRHSVLHREPFSLKSCSMFWILFLSHSLSFSSINFLTFSSSLTCILSQCIQLYGAHTIKFLTLTCFLYDFFFFFVFCVFHSFSFRFFRLASRSCSSIYFLLDFFYSILITM